MSRIESCGDARRPLGEGDTFGEVAFFTGERQAASVHTLTVCRVLTVTRAGFDGVAAAFPLSARRVLLNLRDRAQEARRPPDALCPAPGVRNCS